MNSKSSLIRISSEAAIHALLSIPSEEGVHGFRVYDQKIQYYSKSDNTWHDILANDIRISPNAYNILKKLPNGYYVEAFRVSSDADNAIVRKADGYYVKQEKNLAHISDIDDLNSRIEYEVTEIDSQLELITDKLTQISGTLTKVKEIICESDTEELTLVANTSVLIRSDTHVILNIRILIENLASDKDAEIRTEEQGIETMNVTLLPTEVQQYDLGNACNLKIYVNGNIKAYIRITYI